MIVKGAQEASARPALFIAYKYTYIRAVVADYNKQRQDLSAGCKNDSNSLSPQTRMLRYSLCPHICLQTV